MVQMEFKLSSFLDIIPQQLPRDLIQVIYAISNLYMTFHTSVAYYNQLSSVYNDTQIRPEIVAFLSQSHLLQADSKYTPKTTMNPNFSHQIAAS